MSLDLLDFDDFSELSEYESDGQGGVQRVGMRGRKRKAAITGITKRRNDVQPCDEPTPKKPRRDLKHNQPPVNRQSRIIALKLPNSLITQQTDLSAWAKTTSKQFAAPEKLSWNSKGQPSAKWRAWGKQRQGLFPQQEHDRPKPWTPPANIATLKMTRAIGAKPKAPAKPPRKPPRRAALPSPSESPNDDDEADDEDEVENVIDTELSMLIAALTHREPLESKPLPQGHPTVWATDREELCETLPYFKAYRSGCYQNGGTVYAFLLDGVGGAREYFSEEVIICRAGGSRTAENGKIVQATDQTIEDTQPRAVLNAIAHQNPIIIICGNKNAAAAVKMPHRYCVLGWFKPTHVWSEKVAGIRKKHMTTVKYRFERLDRSTPAWYAAPQKSLTDEQLHAVPELTIQQCQACLKTSPQALLVGWVCLNEACDQFWLMKDGRTASVGSQYHPSFLCYETHWSNEEEPFDINPGVPDVGKYFGDDLTYINTRGIVCPQCGRCNARYLFTGWACDTTNCGWALMPQHQSLSVQNLHFTPWDVVSHGPALTKTTVSSYIKVDCKHFYKYKVLRYTIPGVDGCIIHAKASADVVKEVNGPDDMFQALQQQDIGLVRRPFATEHSHEEQEAPVENEVGGRMCAFSMNFGMPYKFIAGGDTLSFDDDKTAWPIRACRSRLDWARRALLGNASEHQFNELYALGYLQGQKINYHDDGEAGLGPDIATLSLGSAATMSLRLKAKYFSQVSKGGLFTFEAPQSFEVLKASSPTKTALTALQWQQRLQGYEELKEIKLGNTGTFQKRSKELATELGLKSRAAQSLLDLHLTHGDIVIMQGEAIQKFFEHAVEPHGNLRFALTCRQVLPEHLAEEQRPAYEVGHDTFGYDGAQIRQANDAAVLEW